MNSVSLPLGEARSRPPPQSCSNVARALDQGGPLARHRRRASHHDGCPVPCSGHPRPLPSAVVWGTLLVVAILIPVLIGLLRGAHLLRPIFPLVDAMVLGVVALLEPSLLPLIACLIITTTAYSASTFGRTMGVVVAVAGASMVVASALIYRPADWLPTLLVLGAGLQAVVVICSKAASVANAMRQAVDDVLESVDTIVWESLGQDAECDDDLRADRTDVRLAGREAPATGQLGGTRSILTTWA